MKTFERVGYLRSVVWEDRVPPGTDVQQAARDGIIEQATALGVPFRWDHDQYGARWDEAGYTDVHGWKSTAFIVREVPDGE